MNVLDFFKLYKPHWREDENGKIEIFTLPTQWIHGFDNFEDAISYCINFIEQGKWSTDETPYSRLITSLEKESPEYSVDFSSIGDDEIDDYFRDFVMPKIKQIMNNG